MYKLKIQHFFDAAHQLPDSKDLVTKECANLHGHTYHVIVEVTKVDNDRGGMVVDFKGIKNVIDELDHKFINDIFAKDNKFASFEEDMPTTAENIAWYLHAMITGNFPDLEYVTVSICEGYKGQEKSSYVTYEE